MQSFNHLHFGQVSAHIKKSFDELLPDPWLREEDGKFRFRSFQKAVVNHRAEYYLKTDPVFYQSETLNHYSGGIQRKYPELRADVASTILLQVVNKFLPLLPDISYNIGIHQIRITTEDRSPGYPAPEGIHQDGFSYIGIYCVGVNNIAGGDTTLISCEEEPASRTTFKLNEGDAVIFNDVNYQHYTSAIVPLLPGKGYRDVFVMTFDGEQEPA